MGAEELSLSFLPPSQRLPLRRSWYRGGFFTELKLRYVFPAPRRHGADQRRLSPRGQCQGGAGRAGHRAFVSAVPAELEDVAAAPGRNCGARTHRAGASAGRIASIKAAKATPFARFLPDLAVVLVCSKDGHARLYSLVHNREHENVSWMLEECAARLAAILVGESPTSIGVQSML